MSTCRNCYATISFVSLDTGKALPINPVPDPTGNVIAKRAGTKLRGYVESREKPFRENEGFRRYRPHHADCHTEAERPRVARAEAPAPLF